MAGVASICSDEELMQKMSALKPLYSGQLTKSTQMIKQNHLETLVFGIEVLNTWWEPCN